MIRLETVPLVIEPADDAKRRAYQWLARVLADDIDDDAQRRLEAWLDASDDHRRAFDRARTTWQRLGAIAADDLPSDLRPPAPGTAADAGTQRRPPSTLPPSPRWNLSLVPLLGGVTAMAVLLLAVLLLLRPAQGPTSRIYATSAGEVREDRLEDGTQVFLGAETRIDVTFSETQRHVQLKAGEAFFDVERHPSRPFVVSTANAEAAVLGTRFAVSLRDESTQVSVAEGRVAVSTRNGRDPSHPPVQLAAGTRVVASAAGISELQDVSPEVIASWRTGELRYVDTRLVDIIADADRYLEGSISVQDSALADARLSLVTKAGDIDGLLEMLVAALPIDVRHGKSGTIFITRKVVDRADDRPFD